MKREQEILERGAKLPEVLRHKFGDLLLYYVEHGYDHDEVLNKLEEFLNNFEKEDI